MVKLTHSTRGLRSVPIGIRSSADPRADREVAANAVVHATPSYGGDRPQAQFTAYAAVAAPFAVAPDGAKKAAEMT